MTRYAAQLPAIDETSKVETVLRRFTCTQCGKCCNRSPEVELSEAASLADIFVFRLMFRLYWLPRHASGPKSAGFYEKKRLLTEFSARKYPVKVRRERKSVEFTKYLVISALALDTKAGACGALHDNRCSIYDRRPLTCRSVPFHYSRAEALAASDLEAFVSTGGYRCDTSDSAEVVLEGQRIVAPQFRDARAQARTIAASDRPWAEAIVRHMNGSDAPPHFLPSLEEVEAHARVAATTAPLRTAWQIAVESGLMTPQECDRLVELQLRAMARELAGGASSQEARETLSDMHRDYRNLLSGGRSIASGEIKSLPSP